jgi:hypothetical protein
MALVIVYFLLRRSMGNLPSLPLLVFYLNYVDGTVMVSSLGKIPKNDIMCFIDYRIYRTPSSISYKESIKKDIINKECVF